jgi:UDP-arabinose 4-epimerase
MRVLVTGGAGYIGSHSCKAFAREGWEVWTLDNLSRGWRDAVRWGPLIEADLTNREATMAALREAAPDLVVHFAALAYVEESVRDPAAYYRTNVAGTQNLLDAMRMAGCDRLVFSSTCASYGVPDRLPIDEGHAQAPINPYGRSKLIVEQMIADYAAAYGLSAVFLRYFNAAGGDPEGEIGERHEPETHLIPLAIGASLGKTPFTVNGTDFPTRDGTALRDFIHVTDLASAHVLAAQHRLAAGETRAFNLGTGRGATVREVIAAVERHTGRPITVTEGPRRPGDPAELVADCRRAEAELGFVPRHSSIDEIVGTELAWQRRAMR